MQLICKIKDSSDKTSLLLKLNLFCVKMTKFFRKKLRQKDFAELFKNLVKSKYNFV